MLQQSINSVCWLLNYECNVIHFCSLYYSVSNYISNIQLDQDQELLSKAQDLSEDEATKIENQECVQKMTQNDRNRPKIEQNES